MTLCVELLRFLEEGHSQLPPELAEHVASCPACTTLMAAWPDVTTAGQTVRDLRAPSELVAKIAALPRLPLACEQACEAATAVLDREASEEQRVALMDHLAQCPACRTTWDALATVRQVGEVTRAPQGLLPRLAAIPLPRIESKGRRWRLAAAAVYILAGTIFLAMGNSEVISREAVGKVSDAFFYGQAAVTNRLRWAEKEVKAWLSQTQKLARDSLSKAVSFWQETVSPQDKNLKPQKPVSEGEEEGRT
uniref:Putative zinc-finger domain-containing protein n=1 Tax=Thermoanaerobaculum aquaticum TaxID=1312852 RepID=A0A7V1ZHB3_9BACT